MKHRLIIFILIVFSLNTFASSPEARQQICAAPSTPVEKSDKPKTEADANCTDCLAKVEVSKEVAETKKAAENIAENVRKKRDLQFFKLVGFSSYSTSTTSTSQIKDMIKAYKLAEDYYKVLGLEIGSEEQKLFQGFVTAQKEYTSVAAEKKEGSEQQAKMKGLKKDILSFFDTRITLSEKAALQDSMYKSYFVEGLQRMKKARASLDKIYEKVESAESIAYEDANSISGTYLYPYNPKDNQKKIEDLEKQLAELEAAEKKKTEGNTSDDGLTAEENSALEAFEKQARSALSGRMEEGLCGMSAAEQYTIMDYTGSGYGYINKALRSGDQSEKAKIYRDVMNSALGKLKSFTGDVRRGTSYLPDAVLEKHQLGAVVPYEAFTSTSTAGGFGGTQRYIIKSKTGKFVAPISSHEGENEVIFAAGTKFKVLDIKFLNPPLEGDSDSLKSEKKKNVEITMEEAD